MHSSIGLTLLLDAALKGTLVLLAASALVVLLRRGSAASRHLIWQFAVFAVLGLPIVKMVSPFRLPVLPQWRSPIVAVDRAPTESDKSVGSVAPGAQIKSDKANDVSTKADAVSPPPFGPLTSTTQSAQTPWTVRFLTWLALAWIVVAGGLLIRLLLGFILVRWFALRAYPLYEEGWAELNGELCALIGLRRSVSLYASPHVATPMTWGIVHPVVMLPSSAEDWSIERRRVVLLHELAHVRRKDSLMHMIAQVTCAVYWFHPLVWKAAARMRAEAERACDDLVLRAGTKASVYADHLLELIRTIGGMRTPALALPMAQRSTFEGRLLAILEPHLDRTTPRRLSVLGMVVVVGLILFPLAGLTTANSLSNGKLSKAGEADEKTSQTDKALDGQPAAGNVNEMAVEAPRSMALEQVTEGIQEISSHIKETASDVAADKVTWFAQQQGESKVTSFAQQKSNSLAVASLVRALDDSNVDVRLAAAQSLGEMEDSLAVAALSNALRTDSDARVRKMAAWALGNIESEAAVPALVYALRNDKDIEVRRTSIWALGQVEDASAVDALGSALGDADKQIRSLAVWALGQIEDAKAIPVLLTALKDSDVEIRRQAAWALGQIEDDAAVPALSTALQDGDAEVRSQAVWALGEIESARAVPALAALVNDASEHTRKQVAWALGEIEDAGAIPALTNLLRDDKSAEVRQQAAWALGQIESAAAVPALATALKDASSSVRNQAAWALGQIEARPAPQALLDALKDSDRSVRSTAAWALAQIEDPNAAAALRGAMKDTDPAVRRAVLNALVSIGDQLGYEALADMLKDPDPEVRRAAAAALGGKRYGNPDPRPQPQPRPQPRPMPQPLR